MSSSPKRDRTRIRINAIIGHNIRSKREAIEMSRDELAKALGVSVSHIGLIERGERGATAVTLEKLSRVFNTPIDNFFIASDNMSITIHEDGYDSSGILATIRQKISSLITHLDEDELKLLVHVIKGVGTLKG